MPHAPSASLTRRGLLAAGGALGLGALLAACGDGGGPYTLGALQLARALADVRALRRRRLPVVWLHLRDAADGTARLAEAL